MRFKAVIFDLDGTVLNTIDDLSDSANHVLAAHGLPTHTVTAFKKMVGNGIPKLVRRMLPDDLPDETVENILTEFRAYYALHSEDKTAPYPDMQPLLAGLRAAGLKLCVLSNKQHDIAVKVVTHYFGNAFDHIQGLCEAFPPKPAPDSCRALLDTLGMTESDVLYVGDSNVDMQTAANAGLYKCGVSWGFRSVEELKEAGADIIADTPEDILHIALG